MLSPKNVEAVSQLPRNGGGQTNGQHKRSDTQNHTKHGEDIAPHPVNGSVPRFFEGGERPRCTPAPLRLRGLFLSKARQVQRRTSGRFLLPRRLLLDELPLVHAQHPVAVLRHERVVGNHNRALLITRAFTEQVNHFTGELFIQRAGRLVTEQQRRFPDERTRNSYTLLLATGESGDGRIRPVAQPQQGESIRNTLRSLRFGHTTVNER
ncbi:Uncharacterised protein [Mycobacterium tuberculosis]|nr:Uncharacterised protein [Mycobacterium tuberculosis]